MTLDGVVDVHEPGARGCKPSLITRGPDGALWFTRPGDGRVGRIQPDGSASSFLLPTADSNPFGIATGPDGALWCIEMSTDRLAGITPGGDVAELSLGTMAAVPSFLVRVRTGRCGSPSTRPMRSPDTTGRRTTIVRLPTEGAGPVGIAVGPDDALWFPEINLGQVGRVSVDGGGFGMPSARPGVTPPMRSPSEPMAPSGAPCGGAEAWVALGTGHLARMTL